MTIPEGFETKLLKGLAVYLQAAGVGTYKTGSAVYTSSETAIVVGDFPTNPDRAIALGSYSVSDHPSLSDSVIAIQVKCRWAPEDQQLVKDLADAIFDLLHGNVGITLTTGVRITQCQRNSGPASLGQDANKRWANVQNFYASVWRPSTHRT